MFRITFLAVAFAAAAARGQEIEQSPLKVAQLEEKLRISQAQDIEQPPLPELFLIDRFLPHQAVRKGHFVSEEQLEKLSPEARAEFEKLLKEKPIETARLKTVRTTLSELQKNRDGSGEQAQKTYRFMIGVAVEPEGDHGVVVKQVVEDSPAAAAGIERGDVILSVRGTRIVSQPGDLMDAVEDSRGKELVLVLRRPGKDGEEKRVKVVPVERGESLEREIVKLKTFDGELDYRFRTIHPGILWKHSDLQQILPENVTISVSKTGKEPARITVKRGDESWLISQGELDQLPEDLRPHVQRLLAGPGLSYLPVGPKEDRIAPGTSLRNVIQTQTEHQQIPATQPATAKELQKIRMQLEALRQAVEKLQQKEE